MLDKVAAEDRSLLIVAEKVEGEALETLRVNVERGVLRCVPVRAPGFGDRRTDMVHDLAVLTGATVVNPGRGLSLGKVVLSDLGSAEQVVVSKFWTEIIGGAGSATEVQNQIDRLRAMLPDASSDYDREKLDERIALLAGRHVTIMVGGHTAENRRATKSAVTEGLAACRAATMEGVIVGATSSLVRVAASLQEHGDQGVSEPARRVMTAGLEAPLRSLIENSGGDPETILAKVVEGDVYDARKRALENSEDSRVLDAVAIAIRAVEVAASVAAAFLRTGTWSPRRPD